MEHVRHHGRHTAYRRVDPGGSGPPTLYVHGSGGTHEIWNRQLELAGPAHPAAAVDLSGHGESDDVDTDPGPETVTAYARDVIAVAEATNARVLVGNSLGGAIVQTIALDHEFTPDGLVLAGSGAKLAVLEELRNHLETDFERAVGMLHEPDMLFHDADDGAVIASREITFGTGQAVTRRDLLTCHVFDVRNQLGNIRTPTLAICGEQDRLTPVEYHEYLADHLPNGEFVVVPAAAHLAMLERPAPFNEAIKRFVREL